MIRVLIADDQALVRSGLRMILEAQDDIEVVAEAADGLAAVELAKTLRPHVVLMDIRMPGMDGLEATRRLVGDLAEGPRVLVLTTFDVDQYVYEAMRAGASGFLTKDVARDQLVHAVRVVTDGEALLAPSVTRRLIEQFVHRPPPGPDPPAELAGLTDREIEVLRFVARGVSNAEIAGSLFLSEATVKTHVNRVLTKLGLRNRAQAVVVAYESGLVQPGPATASPGRAEKQPPR